MSAWILTRSGKQFFPLDPKPESICIEDIAHALSLICRFTGHSECFYSVAEHSIRVSRMVRNLGHGVEMQLAALLHDASEAYIADVARPLKHLPAFDEYRRIERKVQTAIEDRFHLPRKDRLAIKGIDNVMLDYEASRLMVEHSGWPATSRSGLAHLASSGMQFGWESENARQVFIESFDALQALRAEAEGAR